MSAATDAVSRSPKLAVLDAVTEGMDSDERRTFDSVLIGALSVNVPDSAWQRAIRIAADVVARDRARLGVTQ